VLWKAGRCARWPAERGGRSALVGPSLDRRI